MAANKKPRKKHRPMRISDKFLCPGLIESIAIFAPILGALERVRDTGEVYVTQDNVELFHDRMSNETYALLPAMRGWVEVWSRISRKLNRPIELSAIEKLTKRLEYMMPITSQDVQKAIDEIMKCRTVFLTTPAHILRSETRTSMIAIEMQEAGALSADVRLENVVEVMA